MGRRREDKDKKDKKDKDMGIDGDVACGGGTARGVGPSVGDRMSSVKPNLRCSTRGSREDNGLGIMP